MLQINDIFMDFGRNVRDEKEKYVKEKYIRILALTIFFFIYGKWNVFIYLSIYQIQLKK